MKIVDDRTDEQKQTHTLIIAGTDSFMSGWGEAKDGISIAGWACEPKYRSQVLGWVSSRKEMKRVREVGGDYRPGGFGHCHIYVVDFGHPALGSQSYQKAIRQGS